MMSSVEVEENMKKEKGELVIRDLEKFLRRCYSNENLKMIDYKATNLLPLGENYTSIIAKLDVKICKSKEYQEEVLHFVAKMTDPGSTIISWPIGFKKELFVYAELLPMYRKIEREAGMNENDLIDILPKFIGYRNSLNYGDAIDNDSLFIMENLKIKNYYTLDRRTGLDTLHAKKSFEALAKYHAMGIAMMQKCPEFSTRAIEIAKLSFIKEELLDEYIDCARRSFSESPQLSKYLDKLESSVESSSQLEVQEPWITINHSDFWTNNIMFHKDEKGTIDDVKLIDFQTFEYGSPLEDIGGFVGCSFDEETLDNHVDEIFDVYYESFITTLKQVGCDTKQFTKESFEAELKKYLFANFVWCLVAIRNFVHEIQEEDTDRSQLQKNVLEGKTSEVCKERYLKLVKFYESRNWFL